MMAVKGSILQVKFREWDCIVQKARFMRGGLALMLIDAHDRSPVARATINVEGVQLADDEVIVKDYSENEGMFEALTSAGIVEDTGKRVRLPYGIVCPVCRVVMDGGSSS